MSRNEQKFESSWKGSRRPESPKRPSGEDSGMTRRQFLRFGVGAAAAAAGATVAKKYGWDRFFGDEETETETARQNDASVDEASRQRIEAIHDLEQKTVFEALRIRTYEDLAKPIEINKKTFEATCRIWEARYLKEKKQDMINAYDSFRYWRPAMRRALERELKGVPQADEEFITLVTEFLPIAESDGYFKKPSRAGAQGPYQIMSGTQGLLLKRMEEEGAPASSRIPLKSANGYEPKHDPVLAATMAGKCFKDLLTRLKEKDLAVSGYNGNFVNDYRRRRIKEAVTGNLNYEDFLRYAEEDINAYRTQVFKDDSESVSFRVRRGDDWESISKYSGASVEELKKANQGKPDLQAKDDIKIPLVSREVRIRMMQQYVSGYIENLTYPAKIYGLRAAAEKLGLRRLYGNRALQWREIKVQDKTIPYTVKKGDTLAAIVQRMRKTPGIDPDSITVEAVKRANGMKSDVVREKQVLRISTRSLPNRLTSLTSNEKELEALRLLNPSIQNEGTSFPSGTVMRVPAGDYAILRDAVLSHNKIEQL